MRNAILKRQQRLRKYRDSRLAWKTIAFLALTLPGLLARGQTVESARNGGASLWAGGEFSNMEAGFPVDNSTRISGIGAVGLYRWNHSLGLVGEINFLRFQGFEGETETSFLGGPRYTFLHSIRWRPYAQLTLGDTKIHYPFELGTGRSFTIAPAGGLSYELSRHWLFQAQYEYQILTNSPNFTDEPHFGIHPQGFQIGVLYRIPKIGH